ncbi:hypothetical protein [Erwinia sp. QL-Z3]|uniref:hypothetical protein n=1 Tax=Erwinia sp. QL-Z3 TaxID=2547962 RepID=UPI001FD786A8|nr:hypothetical protein [Erwinia sp. QL-Z3]
MMKFYPQPALVNIVTMEQITSLGGELLGDEAVEIFGVVTYAINKTTSYEFHERPCI